jgi:nicotinamidase-related amidase
MAGGIERTKPSTTAVLVVDVQDKLVATIPPEQMRELERATRILLGAAAELGAPVLATEQYPKGLGPTIEPIRGWLGQAGVTPVEKTTFSASKEPKFLEELRRHKVDAVIVLGMESHICVFQTVRDLVSAGLRVDVPIDGVASRREDHRATGLALCEKAGATLTTAETILFDWLVQSGTDTFRRLSRLVR